VIKTAHLNILEKAAVTLVAGTAHADYPLYRLWDRLLGKCFKTTAAETVTLKADMSAVIESIVNLMPNPSFETGDYTGHTPSAIVNYISLNDAYDGTRKSHFAASYFGGLNQTGLLTGQVDVDTAVRYGVALRVKVDPYFGGTPTYEVELVEYDSIGTELASTVIATETSPGTGYVTHRSIIGPAGSGAPVTFQPGTAYIKLREKGTLPVDSHINVFLDLIEVFVYPDILYGADRLLIPAGHNLDGLSVTVKYSYNDLDYSTAVTQVVSDGLIDLSWDFMPEPFWKVHFTGAIVPVEIPELFLTRTYEHERNPRLPSGPHGIEPNALTLHLAGGATRGVEFGEPKRLRLYDFKGISDAQLAELMELENAWRGINPFWLYDHEGQWIYVELTGGVRPITVAHGRHDARLYCREVHP
jgi:hypothetical protein